MLPIVFFLATLLAAEPSARPPHGEVHVDTLWSQALGTHKQLVVYLPPSYARDSTRRYPVAYYLHGLWGSEWDWVRQGHIDAVMDSLIARGHPEMIVVMPDGDDGWYTTWNSLGAYRDCVGEHSPLPAAVAGGAADTQPAPDSQPAPAPEPAASYCVPWPHYDDYIARDVVAHVDSTFRTLADRRHRAIGGLSMGGYGAVTLAFSYPDVWSAAASHSGVLSPMLVGRDSAGAPRFGRDMAQLDTAYQWTGALWPTVRMAFGRDTAAWWSRDPARRVRLLRSRGALAPALYLDIGRDDRFLDENRVFHAELTALGVTHLYREWPGTHDWSYWHEHVAESLAWIGERMRGRRARRGGEE